MTTKKEQIAEARSALALAESKLKELEQAAEFLRDELPRTQQAVRSLRDKLCRLEKPAATKSGRASELAWLENQLAELKEA
ncbi:putative RNase H-like nuclease (RuvC/YqgF family) [Metapseudomonas resinovorans]|uniref:hypothetical protein n=1 Tax=Metapseudomonas resinovorans TaxID=53412 RepID=UPI003D19EDA6